MPWITHRYQLMRHAAAVVAALPPGRATDPACTSLRVFYRDYQTVRLTAIVAVLQYPHDKPCRLALLLEAFGGLSLAEVSSNKSAVEIRKAIRQVSPGAIPGNHKSNPLAGRVTVFRRHNLHPGVLGQHGTWY